MIILVPEKLNFKISTTDVEVYYRERDGVQIKAEGLLLENFLAGSDYTLIDFDFKLVAELKCISLNFFEAEYDNYKVVKVPYENAYRYWSENGYHPDAGFYTVQESEWLSDSRTKYDPKNSLNLKHFIITGNDSYVELLASSYKVK